MSSRTIMSVNEIKIADEQMDSFTYTIGMGRYAYIVYSYLLNSIQILESIKKEIASFRLPLPSGGCNVNGMLSEDGKLYINGINSQWRYDLIESVEDNFGAVIFSIVPLRSNESAEEWNTFVDIIFAFRAYFEDTFCLSDCVVEQIEIPEKRESFENNGFSFIHSEVADAFRKSVLIKRPYETKLVGNQVQKPSWYVTGKTIRAIGNTYNNSSSGGGCYVATAVYGSYDCPEVWTLRRFRDLCLSQSWYGRTFIRVYYATSPTLVKFFGETEWFKHFWKNRLDKWVVSLKRKGYGDSPYHG